MPESLTEVLREHGLVAVLILIAAIVLYTIAKVWRLNRQSEKQWSDVDKSKLKEWEDDDW